MSRENDQSELNHKHNIEQTSNIEYQTSPIRLHDDQLYLYEYRLGPTLSGNLM